MKAHSFSGAGSVSSSERARRELRTTCSENAILQGRVWFPRGGGQRQQYPAARRRVDDRSSVELSVFPDVLPISVPIVWATARRGRPSATANA